MNPPSLNLDPSNPLHFVAITLVGAGTALLLVAINKRLAARQCPLLLVALVDVVCIAFALLGTTALMYQITMSQFPRAAFF